MSFAKITLSGTVVSVPEKRFTPNNTAVTSFGLSVTPAPRPNGEVDEPYTIPVTCWNRLAEVVAESLKPGDIVIVDGKLQINTQQSPEGVNKKSFEIEAQFISKVTGTVEALNASGGAASGGASAAGGYRQPAGVAAASAPASAPQQGAPVQSGGFEPDFTEDDIPF